MATASGPRKGQGAGSNPAGRFESRRTEVFHDDWDLLEEEPARLKIEVREDRARSIISHNDSPDIGFDQSINPYRGCEHACIYCFARPTHSYLNLSPGLDFETKLFYKGNAAEVLGAELRKPGYVPKIIALGTATDPYQPIEREHRVTRRILETLFAFRHPVGVITKGVLIERDLDLLAEMAALNLVSVGMTLTTLRDELKRDLEPRAASGRARLRVIRRLTEAGVPVRVMFSPVIPFVNDHEMDEVLALAAEAGARHASWVMLRLPYEVKDLFREWLVQRYPLKAEHVMSLVQQVRGGRDYDSTFGKRFRGTGQYAEFTAQRFRLACRRNQYLESGPDLDYSGFRIPGAGGQMSLL
ncbi:MAG: radical protein [Hydrocarboniphaga sp.]|uniref:PA0069 family radical SAM protein n=1 Tax=Hydrocarboniphaga sp. TaxID=2033016 RepID=UPI002609CA7B|nr:PA0069 family radical SAM protein [Hydrocarboniphaga sp.]MDB5970737.1 radical protein [Hydrocarboniphaga sp.]